MSGRMDFNIDIFINLPSTYSDEEYIWTSSSYQTAHMSSFKFGRFVVSEQSCAEKLHRHSPNRASTQLASFWLRISATSEKHSLIFT